MADSTTDRCQQTPPICPCISNLPLDLPSDPVCPLSLFTRTVGLNGCRDAPDVLSGRSLFPRPEDEELTNLNWLHESSNLLNSFGDPVLRSVSPVLELDHSDGGPPSPSPLPTGSATSDPTFDLKQNPNCKPPYSFSCLIFMAIEDSPSKRLPVKDIYNWILLHFPYFANAPTGWKNSVRHNLSLNKCFKKVDKDRSQRIVGCGRVPVIRGRLCCEL
ncbi:hypothetical protein JZ751_004821 [Albula glossodonta]|uniref:Fork-head domain-containing protein n=1 Tax=Albula glossodonta TaxID=121402 RepID=A0A8T2P434_9TELE|nr:hypothetical protein JZ751_004821 [Albula glossodonta]